MARLGASREMFLASEGDQIRHLAQKHERPPQKKLKSLCKQTKRRLQCLHASCAAKAPQVADPTHRPHGLFEERGQSRKGCRQLNFGIAYQIAVVPEHHITDPLTPLFKHGRILSARMTF
jgi:hypothetical protein